MEREQNNNGAEQKDALVAIIINFLFPGLGYLYIGKTVRGLIIFVSFVFICLKTEIIITIWTWIATNIVMEVDMIVREKKNDLTNNK